MLSSWFLDDWFSSVSRALGALAARLDDETGFATTLAGLMSISAAATILATASLTGEVELDELTRTVDESLGRVSGSLELRGAVVARASGSEVETIEFPVGYFGEGHPVRLDAASPATDRLTIALVTDSTYNPDLPYSARFLSGDGDEFLEPGETAVITLQTTGASLHQSGRFSIDLSAPVGGIVGIARRLPFILQPVMQLP